MHCVAHNLKQLSSLFTRKFHPFSFTQVVEELLLHRSRQAELHLRKISGSLAKDIVTVAQFTIFTFQLFQMSTPRFLTGGYLLVTGEDKPRVMRYCTLSGSYFEKTFLPSKTQQKRVPCKNVSGVTLGRLAIDKNLHRQGYGEKPVTAESFVKTIKRDYISIMSRPDRKKLAEAFERHLQVRRGIAHYGNICGGGPVMG